MAMTVRYLTIDGEIISETRNGVRSDYIPDPLGSTAALINSSHTITDTFLWWPYGEQRSHVGSSVTPFGFSGGFGYYSDAVGNRLKAKRRLFRPMTTSWQTVDYFWPRERPYCHGDSQPSVKVDPWGFSPQRKAPIRRKSPKERFEQAQATDCIVAYEMLIAFSAAASPVISAYNACVAGSGCPDLNSRFLTCLVGAVCDTTIQSLAPSSKDDCGDSTWIPLGFERVCGHITLYSGNLAGTGCDRYGAGAPYHMVLLHESMHLCGVDHPNPSDAEKRCNNIMSCCMLRATGILKRTQRCR